MMANFCVDILCLMETWHKDVNNVPIKRLRTQGFQVVEQARPLASATAANTLHYTKYGGAASRSYTRQSPGMNCRTLCELFGQ